MTRIVAIYCRISEDRTGAGLGVERQEADGRALAERLGWQVATVHTDNDISAYSGKRRPGYDALLADLRAGRANAVIAWHPDRLHRRPLELETFIAVCEEHGIAIQTCRAGEVDLSTASGRAVARTIGAWARAESETKAERIQRQRQQAAEAGAPHGGRRPFGFMANGIDHEPAEATVIRQGTELLLAGGSLAGAVKLANESGLRTTFGNHEWSSLAWRNVLIRPRNAGLRQHRGEILGRATWEPIVPEHQWRALVAILTDPSRRTSPGNGVKWLGSGLYLCGRCGSGLRVQGAGGNRTRAYRCPQRGGGHVTRAAAPLDEYVTAVIVARLARPDAVELLRPVAPLVDLDALRTDATAARARLREIAEAMGDGDITMAEARIARERAQERLQRAERAIAEATIPSPLAALAGVPDVAEVWPGLDLGIRRAVLDSLVVVTVKPMLGHRPQGGPGYFDPGAVKIEWKAQEEA